MKLTRERIKQARNINWPKDFTASDRLAWCERTIQEILDHIAATLPEEEEAKAAEDGAMQAAREVLAWGKDNQGLISLQEIAAIIRKHMPKP